MQRSQNTTAGRKGKEVESFANTSAVENLPSSLRKWTKMTDWSVKKQGKLREREAVEQAQLLEWKQFDRLLVDAISELRERAGYHLHHGECRKVRMEPTDATP